MRGTTAAEFAAHLHSQIGVSTKLVSDLGLKAEQQNDTFAALEKGLLAPHLDGSMLCAAS